MPDFVWTARSPLEQTVVPGSLGVAGQAGVKLSEIRDFNLVQIMTRRGKSAAAAKAVKAHFGVAGPAKPNTVAAGKSVLIWSGPDQVMALSARGTSIRPLDTMREAFAGIASLSDQSDGRCMVRVSGPRARDLLAKLSSIDLHDSVFPVGAAAATSIDHTAVNLWREADAKDGSPTYSILFFSSFADSLWHTITDSAAEYGIEVAAPHGLDS
ncbi:sarcosine oxidase subunit gamma [Pseudaminobacter sp. NGMCC 1.201702]|uniref:sarcosine oxidase subunit gamma n=1 Tax=Pseudaminobacter sp. NGMCC 1.201702 TaxID=3391825 RepID=UPI0039EEA17F